MMPNRKISLGIDVGSTVPSARVKVDVLLNGCVLRGQYAGSDGHRGESLSIYDSSRKVWHQSWVTNRGELLTIEGTFQNGEMVLAGADCTADEKKDKFAEFGNLKRRRSRKRGDFHRWRQDLEAMV
jgi:hypothetical protein